MYLLSINFLPDVKHDVISGAVINNEMNKFSSMLAILSYASYFIVSHVSILICIYGIADLDWLNKEMKLVDIRQIFLDTEYINFMQRKLLISCRLSLEHRLLGDNVIRDKCISTRH